MTYDGSASVEQGRTGACSDPKMELEGSASDKAYLDNLISREVEARDIGCVASHEVTVKDAKNRFVGDDEKVILFAL